MKLINPPNVVTNQRLAIIGEAPESADIAFDQAFGSPANRLLQAALQQAGLRLDQCFRGYLAERRIDKSCIDLYDEEFSKLMVELDFFKPNMILLLGPVALELFGINHSLEVYRGSVFQGALRGFNSKQFKCVATWDCESLLKRMEDSAIFGLDVQRAVSNSEFPEIRRPIRNLQTKIAPMDCINRMNAIPEGSLITFDIEGGVPNPSSKVVERRFLAGITCCSIGLSPTDVFIVPFNQYEGVSKILVIRAFMKLMGNEKIKKIAQNGLYDWSALAWHWKLNVRGVIHDTMVSAWECYPELGKGLGIQTSIFTDEPYYKSDRTIGDIDIHHEYCCKDSAVTYEIHQRHMEIMNPEQRKHYEFNMSIMPALRYMTMRGIKVNQTSIKEHLAEVDAKMKSQLANIETMLGKPLNPNSPPQLCAALYDHFKLPPKYAMEAGRKTNRRTADKLALLKLCVETESVFAMEVLKWKKLEGVRKQLETEWDRDGRMHSSYNGVGTDTGRLSSSTFVSGKGTNLQTIMESCRRHYIPDEGMEFFQLDLSGADGWTVAARCADLGDDTMLEDYYFGLKPAKILACMQIVGSHVSKWSRKDLKDLIKSTPLPGATYDVCKVVQHGTNYEMGPRVMSDQVLQKSFKSDDGNLIFVRQKDCQRVQQLYNIRYPGVQRWKDDVARKIISTNKLECASGHVRNFLGRTDNHEVLKQALSTEPQNNTTYATNLAMLRLWTDPENRREDGSLIVEVLHSVHDALCGQFHKSDTEFAVRKLREWFNNPIKIGSTTLVIPFEGGYGPSWYHTKEETCTGRI